MAWSNLSHAAMSTTCGPAEGGWGRGGVGEGKWGGRIGLGWVEMEAVREGRLETQRTDGAARFVGGCVGGEVGVEARGNGDMRRNGSPPCASWAQCSPPAPPDPQPPPSPSPVVPPLPR